MRWGLLLLVLLVAVPAAGAVASGRLLYATTTYGSSGAAGIELFSTALDGTDVRLLTTAPEFASQAKWSPDGSEIAYASNRDTNGQGGNEIYVVGADGTNRRRLTFDATLTSGFKGSPAWSPDGKTIAFATAAGDWTVPAAGGAPTRLTTQLVGQLSWSPDGSRLLGVIPAPSSTVATVDVPSGAVRQLAAGYAPAWSPTGDRIVFEDAQQHVSVMNADGSAAHEPTDMSASQPQWIDERTLVFTGNHIFTNLPSTRYGPQTRTNLYSVPVDGSAAPARLTGLADDFEDYRAANHALVSPDRQQILFTWVAPPAFWRMNTDGTCVQPVPLPQNIDGPFWQPGSAPGHVDCAELWASLTSAVDKNPVALGETATETVTVENHGNQAAHRVVVRGSAITPVTTIGGCLADICELGTIAAHSSARFSFTLSSTRARLARATYTVTADEPSPAPQLATGSVALDVRPCTLVGTESADKLYGTAKRDRICALAGADYVTGGKGDDWIDAGNGNDTVYGGAGHDTIYGRDGRDTIFARDGVRDYVDCGLSYDVAVVDKLDTTVGCERVLRH